METVLEYLSVQGFRSLKNFEMAFSPGLNVAVGPNGAGKTNLITFLGFVSQFVSGGVHSAFAFAQGAPLVFSRERQRSSTPSLTFRLKGRLDELVADEFATLREERESALGAEGYDYQCRVRYNRKQGVVWIASEMLSITFKEHRKLKFTRITKLPEENSTVSASLANHALFEAVKSHYRLRRIDVAAFLNEEAQELDPQESIFGILARLFLTIRSVRTQIATIRSVNIDPARAKSPTQVTSRQAVTSTGAGLTGNLFLLKSGQLPGVYSDRREETAKVVYNRIESWVREANPFIESLSPRQDIDDGTFKVDVQLSGVTVPFAAISDGTAKWAALVTTLSIVNSVIVIEEPENFLHPRMQEVFVQLCRLTLAEPGGPKLLLVTTHSETLLNLCEPNELLMFEFDEGGTRCSRPINADQVREQVLKTRFKLGHFYKIGALDSGVGRGDDKP